MSKHLDRIILAYNKGYRVIENKVYYKNKSRKLNNQNGYSRFSIRNEVGKLSTVKVHVLVAYQKFKEEILKENIVVRHLDNNSLNNLESNITIGTNSDNMQDIPKEKRIRIATNASSFIKQFDHTVVVNFYNNCKSYNKTMTCFGIKSKSTLHFILKRNN